KRKRDAGNDETFQRGDPRVAIMTPRKRHYFENQFRRTPRVESRERVADWLQPVLRHPLIRCGVAFLEQVLDERSNRIRVAASPRLHKFFRPLAFSRGPDLSSVGGPSLFLALRTSASATKRSYS